MAFADALDGAPVSLMHDENTPPNTNASSNKDTFSNTETPLLQVNPHRPTFLHLSPKICLKDLKGICRLVRQRITVYSNIYYNQHYVLSSMCAVERKWSVAVTMHLQLNEFLQEEKKKEEEEKEEEEKVEQV